MTTTRAVNSDQCAEVNRLSPLMRGVLGVLERSDDPFGQGVFVQQLVRAHGGTRSAKASVSRALRRLWLRGLVDLHNSVWAHSGRTMSERSEEAKREAAEAEADPLGSYARERFYYAQHIGPSFDPWGSHGEYLARKQQAAARIPSMRVVRVTLPKRAS